MKGRERYGAASTQGGAAVSKILTNFRTTILLSLVLAIGMILAWGRAAPGGFDLIFWQAVARWVHVAAGILWIGLLYYFNFVQIRVMPSIPAELKPAISKHIAPEALFWFRWAALVTVLAGLAILILRGHAYASEVLSFGFAGGLVSGDQAYMLLGTGIWLAIIMFLNVWASSGRTRSAPWASSSWTTRRRPRRPRSPCWAAAPTCCSACRC